MGVDFFMRKRKKIVIWITYRKRYRMLLSILGVMVLIGLLSLELPNRSTIDEFSLPLSGKRVAVDAGHGGADGGAESKEGLIEKDITIAIALYLRDYLQQAGAEVIMTREEDVDLAEPGTKGFSNRKRQDLITRGKLVEESDVDFMISVHLNAIPQSRWKGAQTFYFPNQDDSKLLAELIQDELVKNIDESNNRKAKSVSHVYLLKAVSAPSALVEVGFLSNPGEARLMAQTDYQKKLAASIYRGVLRYTAGESLGSE
jgi:N-acetylmuramoyl-L-alanine amidase